MNSEEQFFTLTTMQNRLLSRLALFKQQADSILVIAPGSLSIIDKLRQNYPKANIFAFEPRKSLQGFHENITYISGSAKELELEAKSMDLVIGNGLSHTIADIEDLFNSVLCCLKANGVFCFSLYGPETWKIDNLNDKDHFCDMHHIGDSLKDAGFTDPVMDSQDFHIEYQQAKGFIQDLENSAEYQLLEPELWQRIQELKPEEPLTVPYQFLFGHAIAPETINPKQVQYANGNIGVDISTLSTKKDNPDG